MCENTLRNICIIEIVSLEIKTYLLLLMTLFPLSFISVSITPSKPKSILPTEKVTTPVLPQPTTAKLSKPQYRNAELEKLIAKKKDGSELDLYSKQLTAQDMEIVAYYALQENKVSNIVFYIIIRVE
jgi:hypothetical protein